MWNTAITIALSGRKVVKTCLINFMRSSNWCKNLAEILASSWKASSSLWAMWSSCESQQPLYPGRNSPAASTEQGTLLHALSLASLLLSHVLSQTWTAKLKGEKEKCLNLSGKLSPSFTGLKMIVYEEINSTLCQHFMPALERLHKQRIGIFVSKHKQSCLTLMFLKLYYRRLWCFLLTPWHLWELSMNIHWNKMLNMWSTYCSKLNRIYQNCTNFSVVPQISITGEHDVAFKMHTKRQIHVMVTFL